MLAVGYSNGGAAMHQIEIDTEEFISVRAETL